MSVTPALVTMMVTAPSSARTCSSAAAMLAAIDDVDALPDHLQALLAQGRRPPGSASPSSRSHSATARPASASSRPQARPMPEAPPVTTATRRMSFIARPLLSAGGSGHRSQRRMRPLDIPVDRECSRRPAGTACRSRGLEWGAGGTGRARVRLPGTQKGAVRVVCRGGRLARARGKKHDSTSISSERVRRIGLAAAALMVVAAGCGGDDDDERPATAAGAATTEAGGGHHHGARETGDHRSEPETTEAEGPATTTDEGSRRRRRRWPRIAPTTRTSPT